MSESENIDLPKNLCVTEEVFEQFQAQAAYEDNEFITLSDIVEPPQPTLDLNACLDEIQDDVCIISEPDPQRGENIMSEFPVTKKQKQLKSVNIPINSKKKSSSAAVLNISKNVTPFTTKKKNKRKTNTISTVNMKEQFNTSSESDISEYIDQSVSLKKGNTDRNCDSASDRLNQSSTSESDMKVIPTTKRRKKQLLDLPVMSQATIVNIDVNLKPRKRGRPKKVNTLIIQEHQDDKNHYTLPSNEATVPIDCGETNIKINNSSNSDNDLSSIHPSSVTSVLDTEKDFDKRLSRKCGRAKKSNPDSVVNNRLVSNNVTNNSSIAIPNETSSVSSSKSEKGKAKNKVDDKKYDEIELELIRMLTTPTDELEAKSNKKEIETKQRAPKKRGRPKKLAEEEKKDLEKSINNEAEQAVRKEEIDDEADDICLSSLKKRLKPEGDLEEENNVILNEKPTEVESTNETSLNIAEISTKRNSKKPIMSDFEYNVDTVVSKSIERDINDMVEIDNSDVESPSKRPTRRNTKKVLHYDEGSDEDPFANVELSDDDGDLSGRRGGRYYSDDEYIPGKKKKGKAYSESESSVSEGDEFKNKDESVVNKLGRKRARKSNDSPKKSYKQRKKIDLTQNTILDVTSTAADTTTLNDDDLESSLQSPDITTNDNSNQKASQVRSMSHEFENFIAQKIQGTNLKIKKLTGTTSNESGITPLEIPVLDPNDSKKTIETSTQTNKISSKTVQVQTTSPYESTMKSKVPLTAEQSEKACEFLKGIVKNTSELGQLMIQKSEDFIQKKINTRNVTDTIKMDYCVQKSFLLFKLAKHNLIQMEEDLANEYEQFLQSTNMLQYRESPKCIMANSQETNSDSDCEIVEEPIIDHEKEKEKSKFNLKTVFLNKELSIKIAKKTTEEPQGTKEKVNIKGRHTVWINDSIMVKKVKPTQSFLAQDSRNKKPPDCYISMEMVKEFFDNYYKRQQVLQTCAPFVSPEWLNLKQISVCNYFIAQSNDLSTHSSLLHVSQDTPETNIDEMNNVFKDNHIVQPTSLLTLCTKALNRYMYDIRPPYKVSFDAKYSQDLPLQPTSLSTLCTKALNRYMYDIRPPYKVSFDTKYSQDLPLQPTSLSTLCTKALNRYMYDIRPPYKVSFDAKYSQDLPLQKQFQPNTLFSLSFNVISSMLRINDNGNLENVGQSQKFISLKKLCIKSINKFINNKSQNHKVLNVRQSTNKPINRNIKSLFSCCVEIIQRDILSVYGNDLEVTEKNIIKMKTLRCIAFENLMKYLYNDFLDVINEVKDTNEYNKYLEKIPLLSNTENACYTDQADQLFALTIKSVDTLSDDLFEKLPYTMTDEISCSGDDESNFSNYDEYDPGYAECNQFDNLSEESNWVSRVQLQELKSCFMPSDDNSKTALIKDSNKEVIKDSNNEIFKESDKNCVLTSIKIEPLEETSENLDTSMIKTEVKDNDEITFNPIDTKLENLDEAEAFTHDQTGTGYDVDAFEDFARTSKMLHINADCDLINDDVFSQSTLRVRKQHEPDMDDEFDTNMSLLVPQQNTELAKTRLMKSSSEDETGTQKNITKKKRKNRPKNSRLKSKDASRNKNKPENEVALLTRKMQERIRQEEKSINSSDSELENSLVKLKHDKSKQVPQEKAQLQLNQEVDNQIQCNDVDSTENLNDTASNYNDNKTEVYQKKSRKMSLRKKIKGTNNSIDINNSTEQDNSFLIQPEAPVELLEREPMLPIMNDDMENTETESGHVEEKSYEPELHEESSCTYRHGWRCYPVNNNDTKLYEHTYILLEKLPESFVEIYFRHQGVADKNQDDSDIDRLTNLQTLNRRSSKENKIRNQTNRVFPNGQLKSKNTEIDSRPSSPSNDDYCNELTPSEDEGANVDEEVAPVPPQDATENFMAKNSLMNDVESDSGGPANLQVEVSMAHSTGNKSIKKEFCTKKYKPGPKSKKGNKIEIDSTFLTADKMMNKELALLHAPVTLDVEVKVKDLPKKPSPKSLNRTSTRLRAHLNRVKLQDESSSEEEKQWVTTKEKMLKRMVKKKGNSSVDDAKRAKIVSEFIEKRGDAHDKRTTIRTRKRRSRKKFLERKKQMSVLSRELFRESDTNYTGRKYSQALYGKGRRNIRKVIDKKSLAQSTVIANMEEFERKRRLNMQQTRLREELGCEEGVNVLVINDEVCLEYDFDQMRPVVTVHPFFTKVMKAHQYEGVKFMWDACFESLAMVAAGNKGGGCILAHCMGLGKTLQVLALLHTVLTHPGVGMKRVLVCCPLSTVLNWVDEINKWIGPVTNQIKVFELSKLKKTYERAYQLEDWYKDGGIFIIGYELFRSLTTLDPELDEIKPKIVDKIRHALLNPGPDVVICDEGHLLKNDASVLAVAMSRVATKRRIMLTGTPMQNNLREYYCMVNFVKPSLLGTYAEYSNRFENPIMNGQHRDSQEEDIKLMKARTHILHKVLEGCLQRQEASVLYPYLPKKHEYTVFIPPTKCQWDLYKHYMMTYALEQQQQKQSILKDFHVLQKIWTHPQVLHNFLMKARDERNKIKEEKIEDDLAQEDLAASEDIKPNQTEMWWLQYLEGGGMLDSLESSNKFVVVFQLLDEFITLGDKVLIFSTSLYTLDALEYFLRRINKWSLGQEYFRLDGSVPAEVRQKWCREFNAPNNVNTKLFLISTRAGCLGLNMTAANRVIILDTSWNPAHDIQSIFRVYRFGQKKDCYIYRLVAMGTMEQKIYERSVTKQAVSCRVVDEQQIDRHYKMAELTELYRFDEEGATVEAGLAAGVSDVALLRVAARARLHAVREHDSLLRGSREQHLPEHERNAAWMQFQQEHANNEMQDRLMEANQGIQRIMEANYGQTSGSLPIKMENGEQPQLITSQSGPKGRKSKKKAPANSTIPLEDPKSEQKDVQLDPEKEEAKVKKIMELLLKHNFHTSKRAQEITKLVANVRTIVDARGAGLECCDELTKSIATVMLQKEDVPITSSESAPLTNSISEDTISRPNQSTVKQEVPYESTHVVPDISDETPDDISNVKPDEVPGELPKEPEEITDRINYQNTSTSQSMNGSLLVPDVETERRLRGRSQKYFHEEIFEPAIKRSRRQLRNNTDTEPSSIDDEMKTPLQKRTSRGASTSIGKKSKRLMGKPRRYYASDFDNSALEYYCSKEQSPEIDDEPLLVLADNQKKNERNVPAPPESDVALIDDEDNSSNDTETIVVPDVTHYTKGLETKKSRRAIAVKSTAKLNRPETNLNGKIKRKAALAAEQHLEKLDNDDVVTLDDDDDEWVNDGGKNHGRNRLTNKLATPPRALDTHKKDRSKTTSNIETKSTSETNVRSKKQNESSIVLSDEDDRDKTQTQIPQTDTEPEEAVPLHPSMLSNANFIKIVAYAYQSNRMLDEDAALLAARYSTQKALKEYETTGKGITSGPLYDIAVKVLTKDVLKKLHNKKGLKRNDASLTAMNSFGSTSSEPNRAEPTQKVSIEDKKSRQNQEATDYTPQPNVVPIGMFKGSAMNQKSQDIVEECILPDDDVCILGTTNETWPSTQNIYKKSNSQQFVITSVKTTKPGRREAQRIYTSESIIPEIQSPVTVSASQTQTHNKSIPRVEPSVSITEGPKFVLGPNTPTYRLSKSNLKIERTTPEVELLNRISSSQTRPCLTRTISERKLIQPNCNILDLTSSNVTPISRNIQSTSGVTHSSNDTICLDSDEEDVTLVNKVAKIVHLSPPLTPIATSHTFGPTPVAVTTSIAGFPLLNNVQGVPMMIRGNKVQPQSTSAASADAQTKANSNSSNFYLIPPSNSTDNLSQPKDITSSKISKKETGSGLKLPKLLPKTSESTKRDDSQTNTKAMINPEDILSKTQHDKQIKKVCKPGDIVRITKQGNLAVLSRVDKLPENLKTQLPKTSEEMKCQQVVTDKCISLSSNASARTPIPGNDPLSILKDVIHIQADEYDEPVNKTQFHKVKKPLNHIEVNKPSVPLKIQSKGYGGTFQYPLKILPDKTKRTVTEPDAVTKKKDYALFIKNKESNKIPVGNSIDLINLSMNNKTVAVMHKSTDNSNLKNAVIVGSSKDIIIRTKQSGSTLAKASTSATNTNTKSSTVKRDSIMQPSDNKKRILPWPDSNSPNKKKSGILRPTQTLEDFDIDDIDDIIELE